MPESSHSSAEDRNKDDIDFCLQLFNNCMHIGIGEGDFINVFRLGRRDQHDPRPLMVQLASYTFKNLIMESLYKLRQAQQKFNNVVIAHDMTRAQRDDCENLVQEAKTLEAADSSGEYLYRVLIQGARQLRPAVDNKNTTEILGSRDNANGNVEKEDKTGSKLRVLYTNADGLLNKRHDLQVLLQSLQEQPDIIAINEFKPKNFSHKLLPGEFNLDGYNCFTNGLDNNKERGVLFYIASDIEVTVLDNTTSFQECIFLKLQGRDFGTNVKQLIIGNIYRSPNSNQDNDNRLFEVLSSIQQYQGNLPALIVGDFNFSSIRWYQSCGSWAIPECANLSVNDLKFVNVLQENLLLQHVVEPTRQRGSDTPHTLDLIITTDDFLSDVEYLSPLGLSDHSILQFNLQFHSNKVITEDKFKLDKGDYDKLRDFLDINWDEILDASNTDVDVMWERF